MEKNVIIDQFLSKALEYLQSAEAFTKKEVPLYVEELLNFRMFENAFWVGVLLLLCVVLIVAIFLIWYTHKADEEEGLTVIRVVVVVVLGFFLVVYLCHIPDLLIEAYKIKNAPRVYLIEYLKNN